ncbi:MAG TPA: ribosome recycling factor [Candidatus Peribacteraceae bacterium]|nr:ribosome recycling factor [Candidatus Peribacteraceae bacterium]
MVDPRIDAFEKEVKKVLEFLHTEFSRLQTGRASAALVDHVTVEAYGTKQPLKAVAGVTIQDARSIVIQPWDKANLAAIGAALRQANVGAEPANDGVVIRLNLPAMTEERRKELSKVVDKLAEEARISIRQQRQKIHDDVKATEKDEDVRYTLLEALDKAVKEANDKIEDIRKKKEQEIMTV